MLRNGALLAAKTADRRCLNRTLQAVEVSKADFTAIVIDNREE